MGNLFSSVKSTIVVLLFVGSIFAIPILFVMEQGGIALLIVGLYFLVFGVLTLFGSRFRMVVPYIVCLIGLGICIASLFYIFRDSLFTADKITEITAWIKKNGAYLLGDVIFGSAAVFFLIWILIADIIKRNLYNRAVYAECKDVLEFSSSNRDGMGSTKTYKPVFEYTVDGETYTVEDEISTNFEKISVGDCCELKIDPKNPEKFYRYSKKILSVKAALIFFCLLTVASITLAWLGYFG